jgi:hypothetical protein
MSMSHDAARISERSGPALAPRPTRVVGLLSAAALAVDGRRTDLLGQSCGQPRHAGDVVGLLAVLRDATTDDLLDLVRVDAGLVDHGLLNGAQQFGRVQTGQPAAPLTDGAAGGFDDDRITHEVRLEHVSLL